MVGKRGKYRAIVSSDWNECLAPTGPFDVITFHYPELAQTLSGIFRDYTGNKISLGRAVEEIKGLLPGPITKDHMDAYLDASFRIYRGVPEFIEWCLKKDILFMINTTAFQGFCQRAIAKGLIPQVQVVSAYPMVRYGSEERVGTRWMDLLETNDKPINTQKVMKEAGISPDRVILIGFPALYRGQSRGTFRFLFNAIFYGPAKSADL